MSSSTADLDRTARHSEPPQRTSAEPRPHPIDRRRDVPPQPDRIVVAVVERDPRQRASAVCTPVAHGGRLAIPGRSRDERHRSVMAGVERMANPRPIDHAVMDTRNRKLGLRERDKHVRTCCPVCELHRHCRVQGYIPSSRIRSPHPPGMRTSCEGPAVRMPRFGREPLPMIGNGAAPAAGAWTSVARLPAVVICTSIQSLV